MRFLGFEFQSGWIDAVRSTTSRRSAGIDPRFGSLCQPQLAVYKHHRIGSTSDTHSNAPCHPKALLWQGPAVHCAALFFSKLPGVVAFLLVRYPRSFLQICRADGLKTAYLSAAHSGRCPCICSRSGARGELVRPTG